MKLRCVLTENGPQVEALKQGTSDSWVRLSALEGLKEIGQRFGVNKDLSTNLIGVLELGYEGWQFLSEQVNTYALEKPQPAITVTLPFHPLSFRDFLLFEKHFINASRGFTKRFLPRKYVVTKAYEALTHTTFPKFKPPALWYKQPLYYFGNHLNFLMSGEDIHWPAYTRALDYELELGAVLAKPLFNASVEEAENAIGGYVVVNDLSARDVQLVEMGSGFGPQKAKHFLNAMSQIVVTADELKDRVDNLQASVTINGSKCADCTTAGMQYSLGEAIAFASKSEHLYPGELFGSGTLPGGCGVENGHWLKPGNLLSLTIDGVGELSNKIIS